MVFFNTIVQSYIIPKDLKKITKTCLKRWNLWILSKNGQNYSLIIKSAFGQCEVMKTTHQCHFNENRLFQIRVQQYQYKIVKTLRLQFNSMNTIQQAQATKFHSEEKDEVATQAETFFGVQNPTLSERIMENLPLFKKQAVRQHDICSKLSQGTFSSDKILRLLSAVLKVFRNYNILANLKTLEKVSGQIGQLRRLLRYDRILMIVKEHAGHYQKGRLTKMEKVMVLFKMMIIFGDMNDILAFFMQLKVISNDKLMGNLKKNVANIYFFECLGWLLYHLYEYHRSEDEEGKQKNKMMAFKYVMDTLTTHNDFSGRLFSINPKLASLIGAASSFLNLYLIWK